MRLAVIPGDGIGPEVVAEALKVLGEVAVAAKQVVHAGSDAQAKEAAEILAETRRSLYRLLAEK